MIMDYDSISAASTAISICGWFIVVIFAIVITVDGPVRDESV